MCHFCRVLNIIPLRIARLKLCKQVTVGLCYKWDENVWSSLPHILYFGLSLNNSNEEGIWLKCGGVVAGKGTNLFIEFLRLKKKMQRWERKKTVSREIKIEHKLGWDQDGNWRAGRESGIVWKGTRTLICLGRNTRIDHLTDGSREIVEQKAGADVEQPVKQGRKLNEEVSWL